MANTFTVPFCVTSMEYPYNRSMVTLCPTMTSSEVVVGQRRQLKTSDSFCHLDLSQALCISLMFHSFIEKNFNFFCFKFVVSLLLQNLEWNVAMFLVIPHCHQLKHSIKTGQKKSVEQLTQLNGHYTVYLTVQCPDAFTNEISLFVLFMLFLCQSIDLHQKQRISMVTVNLRHFIPIHA